MEKRGSALTWILVVLVLVVIGVIAYVLIVEGDVGIKEIQDSAGIEKCIEAVDSIKNLDPEEQEGYNDIIVSECYLELARETQNPAVCDKMEEKLITDKKEILKNHCKALATGDLKYCNEIEKEGEMWSDGCYRSVAFYFSNPNACGFMITDDTGLMGKNGCYYSIAKNTKNPQICDNIDSKSYKEGCIEKASK